MEPASDPPQTPRDPRLEIPEILRRPVERPASMTSGQPVGGRVGPGLGSTHQSAKSWAIAMNFVSGVVAGALIGWGVQAWVWPSAKPWPLLAGFGLGLLGGFVRFVKEALAANRDG